MRYALADVLPIYKLYCHADTSLIRNELLNILLAARDTVRIFSSFFSLLRGCETHMADLFTPQTACLLTYVTYIFALHPEIAARLRAEVLEHCGIDGIPSYEVMRGMKFSASVLIQATHAPARPFLSQCEQF